VLTIANAEQAAAWDGPEGEDWARHAHRYERSNGRHRARLLAAGLISSADDVLDVGCGTGALARDVAREVVHGSVLGVDLSGAMLEHARRASVAEGLTNVRFEQADAQVHEFAAGSVDTIVSSFGATFFADPTAAFANLAQALRAGGRIGQLAWRELARNEWLTAIRAALAVGRVLPEPPPHAPGPFGLADAGRARRILSAAGFADIDIQPVDEVVDFGADADDAFDFLSGLGIVKGLTEGLDPATTQRALDALRATVEAHTTAAGVLFPSSAWLIAARRP
jgi:SAM-dependent methyltransferase